MFAMNKPSLVESVVALALQAGEKILDLYQQPQITIVKTKSDSSPLTAADLVAHNILVAGLQQLIPELPILSEESTAIPYAKRATWQRYWLIDPLDGTREFINRTDDFTVNIALIEAHRPILGVVYAPALASCYFAEQGHGAYKLLQAQTPQRIHCVPWQGEAVKVTVSRRHGLGQVEDFLQRLKNFTKLPRGSALKCCLVAEGLADVYPRLSPTSEWDTAAAQCILEQAGGILFDVHGQPLRYNTKESLLNPSFLAVGDPLHDWLQYLT